MISSKEQYMRILDNAVRTKSMPVEHVKLMEETIEALRKVARGAKDQHPDSITLRLFQALQALPDWITEEF